MDKKRMERVDRATYKFVEGGPRKRHEQTRQEVEDKWACPNGTKMAYPNTCWHIELALEAFLREKCIGKVCEVGCGPGRIARFFKPHDYLGLDINPLSISEAERRNKNHKFELILWDALYPTADTYLFFTVLMHIPDAELLHIVKRLDNRVVIVESMSRSLRDYGRDNNYQRDPKEYREAFATIGMKETFFAHCLAFHYPFYLNVQVFDL